MKNTYLILSIIGFILPTILVFMESIETGNILLYTNPIATIDGMFTNRISSIFMIDLMFTLLVFFIWTNTKRKEIGNKKVLVLWGLTMTFGLAGGFPLFLYLKEKNSQN